MSRQANPVAVGAFVLGALGLLLGGVVALGGLGLFAEHDRYSIFFEGGVNGLQAGSRVKAQGVPVGEVIEVRAIADTTTGALSITTETVINIERKRFARLATDLPQQRGAQALIESGLRAQLAVESLLTGQLYVALRIEPDTPVRLVGVDPLYEELPAIATVLEEFQADAKEVLARLRKVPLEEIFDNLNASLASFDKLVSDPALVGAARELELALQQGNAALADARVLVRNVDGQVGTLASSANAALARADSALESLESGSPLSYQLGATLQELAEAAQALRVLANTLQQQPNALLFGKTGGDS